MAATAEKLDELEAQFLPKPAAPIMRRREPLEFTPEQRKIIVENFLPGVDEKTTRALMEVARLRRLNPLTRQIAFLERGEYDANNNWVKKWTHVVTIDGLRAKAEECEFYDGQSEPLFHYKENGDLEWCKVSVYRRDRSHPFTYIAYFEEFAQYKKAVGNNPPVLTKQWTKKHMMLSKCCEAGALRKAFPDELGGLYTDDEMAQEERDVTPPVSTPSAAAARPAGAPPSPVTDAETKSTPPTAAELADLITKAASMPQLQSLIGRLTSFPEGPERETLRKQYGAKSEELKKK